jgi:flagellar basal body-associated protein FliL
MSIPEREHPTGPQRLGHPSTWPAAQPRPAVAYQPPRRKSRAPLVVLAVVAVLALMAGAAGAVWWFTKPASNTAAGSTPSPAAVGTTQTAPSPTPEATLAQLDERATCNAVVPLLDRTVDLVLAYAKREPWNRADAEKLHGELMTLYKAAPPSMRDDIGSQATAVSAILNGVGYDRNYVINSGTRLAEGCRKYAR